MENYSSSDDALSNLRKRGYEADFETDSFCLYCGDLDMRLNPEAYHVDERLRFDDPSQPNNDEIVFAISTCTGVKGILVDENKEGYAPNGE